MDKETSLPMKCTFPLHPSYFLASYSKMYYSSLMAVHSMMKLLQVIPVCLWPRNPQKMKGCNLRP